MKLIKSLHAIYCLLLFVILFFTILPFFLVPIFIESKHSWTGKLNRLWANIFFRLTLFPVQLDYRFDHSSGGPYIFCANHFSYLDIPTMGLNKVNAIFVGKNDMEKIPFFGFMYRKLHITVDRNSLKSKYSTLVRSLESLDKGKSLMIFPEGGIFTKEYPKMIRFKDGAFRMAIEKQIPIVPVTIPFNWIILPDGDWLPKIKPVRVIYHEPLPTVGMTLDNLKELKAATYETIDRELNLQLNAN